MNTHAEKSQQHKHRAVVTDNHVPNSEKPAVQLKDNRSVLATHDRLQEITSNSPGTRQLQTIQAVADNTQPPSKKTSPGRVNKTGLPDHLKSGIENLSGISLDDVKVHRNSGKPAQLQAHAYAQGTDIHLGPGQEKHLPHEAWHVVQQKQGRVQATLQAAGVLINNDSSLEREADLMGDMANRQSGSGTSPLQRKSMAVSAGLAAGTPGIVQRSVGLEIESPHDWQIYDESYNAIVGGHVTLYQTPQFKLESELSGKLEFVIEPPCDTTQDLIQVMDKIVAIARKIEAAQVSRNMQNINVRDEFLSERTKQEVRKNVNLFRISDVVTGAAEGILVSRGSGAFQGGFQATAGVHLSAVPFLMERIARGDLNDDPSKLQINAAIQTAAATRNESAGVDYKQFYTGISPELEGLLNLVYYYIFVGQPNRRTPFPKGLTQVMARTNFAVMLSMTRESTIFAKHPDLWVNLVCKNANVDPGRRIFNGVFGDTEDDTQSVNITIGEWLARMTEGLDKLTVDGGGPAILKTMGSLEKTDDLGGKNNNDRGVIIELRGLDNATKPIGQWIKYAYQISTMVEQLNSRVENKMQANKDVMSKAANLSWLSPALDDVSAMAVDAFHSTFNAQVAGLVIRAKERAGKE